MTTLGPLVQVDITPTPVGIAELTALAQSLRTHLNTGATIKTSGGGQPKVGLLAAKPIKEAAPLFEQVRVDGLPPVTLDKVEAFLTFVETQHILDALDRAWPANVTIPAEDTLHERLQWHVTELQQLSRVLDLGEGLAAEETRLDDLGLKRPDWTNLETVHAYASLVDAAAAKDVWTNANAPLVLLEDELMAATRWDDAAECLHQLHLAIRTRDHDGYSRGYARLSRLHAVRSLIGRREQLGAPARSPSPTCVTPSPRTPRRRTGTTRLPKLEDAWTWASTGAWILDQDTTDSQRPAGPDQRLRRQDPPRGRDPRRDPRVVARGLAGSAHRTGQGRPGPVRLPGPTPGQGHRQVRRPAARRDPQGHGPLPARRTRVDHAHLPDRRTARASTRTCSTSSSSTRPPRPGSKPPSCSTSPPRSSSSATTSRSRPPLSASTSNSCATWPTSTWPTTGTRRPGRTPSAASSTRPSCATAATSPSSSTVAACPEIIGFSNRIAYEPDGVRLIPVRQYGADRLEPIKAVHVADGYERGTTAKVNPAEVDAIVDQIEKCLADPRYDGLTFGVISLLGTAQAKAIETRAARTDPTRGVDRPRPALR